MHRCDRILVIGGSGNVGSKVVTQLLARGAAVRAMARNPEKAGLPVGVEGMRGDLTQAETLDACLAGIDTVFLVWTAPAPAIGPALERITRQARRIVYLSAPIKTPHPFFQQPNPLRAMNERIEGLIEASSAEWTFVRPGMFAGNTIFWWRDQIRAGNTVRWPYLGTHTAPIDEREIAAVAVRALCEDGHAGKDYVITGPKSISQGELIEAVGRAIGRPLRGEEMSPDETRREWASTWPPAVIEMLLSAWRAGLGQPAWVTSTVEEVTGKPALPFGAWAAEHAAAFLG
jgi:uncharacterized protein YbjT (DUF2867 family)